MEVLYSMTKLHLDKYRIYDEIGNLIGTGNSKELTINGIPFDVIYEFSNWVDFAIHVEGLLLESTNDFMKVLDYSIDENSIDISLIEDRIKEFKEESSLIFNPIYHTDISIVVHTRDYWEIRDCNNKLLWLVYAKDKTQAIYQAYTGCRVYDEQEVELFTKMKGVLVLHDTYKNMYVILKDSDLFSSIPCKTKPQELKVTFKDAKRAGKVRVSTVDGKSYNLYKDWIDSEISVSEVYFEETKVNIKVNGLIKATSLQLAAIEAASLKYKVFNAYELKHRFDVFSDAIIMLPEVGGNLV